jgi:hypothetical protein
VPLVNSSDATRSGWSVAIGGLPLTGQRLRTLLMCLPRFAADAEQRGQPENSLLRMDHTGWRIRLHSDTPRGTRAQHTHILPFHHSAVGGSLH